VPSFDMVIKGGTVIDGLRTPRFKADVAIKDGNIAQIGSIDASEGTEAVDASGRVVAPGFVDLHTHYDSQVFWDPWCTMSGWHGVTSVVIGNCGFGFAPCRPRIRTGDVDGVAQRGGAAQDDARRDAVGLGDVPRVPRQRRRTPKGVNMMSLVPLAPLYAYVVGVDKAKEQRASDEELEKMCQLIVEAMEAGGCGWSSQILGDIGNMQRDFDGTPMVTDQMTEREVVAFSRALRAIGRARPRSPARWRPRRSSPGRAAGRSSGTRSV